MFLLFLWICLQTFARIIPCQSVNHTVRYNPERQMCLVITAHKGFSRLTSSVNLHLGCVSVTALYEPFSLHWWEEGNSHLKPCGGVTCQALTCGAAGASCLHDPINQCNSISLEPWLTLTLLCLGCDFPQRLVSAKNTHLIPLYSYCSTMTTVDLKPKSDSTKCNFWAIVCYCL